MEKRKERREPTEMPDRRQNREDNSRNDFTPDGIVPNGLEMSRAVQIPPFRWLLLPLSNKFRQFSTNDTISCFTRIISRPRRHRPPSPGSFKRLVSAPVGTCQLTFLRVARLPAGLVCLIAPINEIG